MVPGSFLFPYMRVVLPLTFIVILFSCKKEPKDPLIAVNRFMIAHIDSMHYHLKAMEAAIAYNKPSINIQNEFFAARDNFKAIESISEFYFPVMSEFINGPALDESEDYDDKIIEATGFQVIEELIFPQPDTTSKNELLQEVKTLLSAETRFKQLLESNQFSDKNIFEAVRLELLRIISLGISGFDSPVALHSIPEAKAALQGIEQILSFYYDQMEDKSSFDSLTTAFKQAYKFLDNNKNFNSFSRADFIIRYITPISKRIYKLQVALRIENNHLVTAVNMDEADFFSENILNTPFFTPSQKKEIGAATIQLGKTLFFDPVLSGNNRRSCASCHQPSKGFADNKRKSVAFNFAGEINRNTPSLINSGFQKSQFWDQRIHFIEDQVNDVITNRDEMHGDVKKSLALLLKSKEYRQLFQEAFGEIDSINHRQIQSALAAYIRSLQGFNSRFDQYMRGNQKSLNGSEVNGFNLFMGKAKCATCHFIPLFNGTVPPAYNDTEAEVLGVPERFDTLNATLDKDLGKYNTFKRELFKNAFKTPTVRNASLTAPYMHNGVFQTLEEVMDFYNRGGGEGVGIHLTNQTLPPDQLGLTTQEQKQIVNFINALTDTTGLTSRPNKLPKFDDPVLNNRAVGGDY
jgi:cytochrome c peroxidase